MATRDVEQLNSEPSALFVGSKSRSNLTQSFEGIEEGFSMLRRKLSQHLFQRAGHRRVDLSLVRSGEIRLMKQRLPLISRIRGLLDQPSLTQGTDHGRNIGRLHVQRRPYFGDAGTLVVLQIPKHCALSGRQWLEPGPDRPLSLNPPGQFQKGLRRLMRLVHPTILTWRHTYVNITILPDSKESHFSP